MTAGVTPGDRTPPPEAAWLTAFRMSSPSESFSTYPAAPATSISRTTVWSSCAVSATTPVPGQSCFRRRVVSMPSMAGMRMSIRTTSGRVVATTSRASRPSPASPTT